MTDSIAINGQMSQATSVWLWVAVIELLVILYLINLLMRRDRKKRKEVKDKLKSGHIDFENTINSAFNSKPLYDKLKVLCHPDRFASTPLEREANAIFQEIQVNRYNYSKLMDLKDQAIKTLHINFK
ncbi:hypothetical protein FR990_19795 [Parabacteroides distasonis]|nr:hypothetical protein F9Z93_20345 [Parabacteroides distasonis]KAB5399754.1 hypothetical protein F9Z92_19625 [Parabacteroides distasonis]TWV33248.1 hypothetical protein FR990_19795 [Parabacteroides distasonis]TWV80653.1 hypothetical protein FR994_19260 [Parabacteroides distasonis]